MAIAAAGTLVWVRVTQATPCPVCGHAKWCSVSEDGRWAFCMHERSDHPAKDGEGWMHRIGVSGPAPAVKLRKAPTEGVRQGRGISVRCLYELRDPQNNVVAYHGRRDFADGSKNFWWQDPTGKAKLSVKAADLPLYGCEHLAALEPATPVVVVEGEKAADALRGVGIVAVGTVTGAAVTPSAETLRVLLGHPVLLWPDNDDKGRAHMAAIGQRLGVLGLEPRTVIWPEAPEKGDAADLVETGGKEAVEALLEAARSAVSTAVQKVGANELVQYGELAKLRSNGSVQGPVLAKLDGLILMSDVKPERVRWLWPGRLPLGKTAVIDGDPGLGKSTVVLDLAARISTGRPMPDGLVGDLEGPAGVVLLTAEDDKSDTVRPRLDAAGADTSRIALLEFVLDEDGNHRLPVIPGDLDRIEAAIAAVDAALVVVDPLFAFLGDSKETNTWRDQDVRRALSPFGWLLARTGCAGVVVRHLNKVGSGNALYRGGGSIGIIGAARIGLIVAPDPDDKTQTRRILAISKSNLAERAPSLVYRMQGMPGGSVRVDWVGASQHTHLTLLHQAEGEDRTALDEAIDYLKNVLYHGQPVPITELTREARQLGIAERTLRRAREQIGVKSEKNSRNGQWTWSWSDRGGGADQLGQAHPGSDLNLAKFDIGQVGLHRGSAPTPAAPVQAPVQTPPVPVNVVEL